jgi:hypothetical protein
MKDDSCAEYGVKFSPPPLNGTIYDEQLAYILRCRPERAEPEKDAAYVARSLRHEYLDLLRCVRERGCDAFSACDQLRQHGSLGDTICARQRACGSPCLSGVADQDMVDLINVEQGYLRPALVAELQRCSQETDCKVAAACWEALKPAVGIGEYPAQP